MDGQQLTEKELENLTFLMRLTTENPWYGFISYIVLIILAVIVFKLGFARQLPLLKSIIVYILLVIGSFVLWLMEFAFGAPMIAVLAISAVFLGAYRYRLHLHRKKEQEAK